jgi:hypothetical protein
MMWRRLLPRYRILEEEAKPVVEALQAIEG